MLIAFRVTNFKSLRETQTLTLAADKGKERLASNTFTPKLAGIDRLVRSAAMYGANASGKSNVVLALQFVKNLVVNSAASVLQGSLTGHIPFKLSSDTANKPGAFEVHFAQSGVRYEYSVSVDSVRIHHECLVAYPQGRPQKWFERTYSKKGDRYTWRFSPSLKGNRVVWRDATRPNALFLSTAVQLNSAQLLPPFEWFKDRLVVVGAGVAFNHGLTVRLLESPAGRTKLLPLLRAADLGISDVEVRREPMLSGAQVAGSAILEADASGGVPSLIRITSFHSAGDSKRRVPFDLSEESHGTRTLLLAAGAWLNVFDKGEVLVCDEIDTHLHPLLVKYLVERFHSDKTNPKNAQLIFSTHDTSLLDARIFRRDQVWFVEKDSKGATALYPLTDFSPREHEAQGRGYLQGRYGGLPVIGSVPR